MKRGLLLLILLSLPAQLFSASPEVITIAGSGMTEDSPTYKAYMVIVAELSKKMGVRINLVNLPPKRATFMLRNGKIHAEMSRVEQYSELVPDSIRVAEPIAEIPLAVYSTGKELEITGWQSLTDYSLAVISGYVYVNSRLPRQNKLVELSTATQAFTLLQLDRVDFFITDIITARTILSTDPFRDAGIRELHPFIDTLKTYTFFSASYPGLAARYEKALHQAREEGFFRRLYAQIGISPDEGKQQ